MDNTQIYNLTTIFTQIANELKLANDLKLLSILSNKKIDLSKLGLTDERIKNLNEVFKANRGIWDQI